MSDSDEPGYFDAYAGETEPCGFALRGFFEEYSLTQHGRPDFEKDFLPQFELFLSCFRGQLPRWSEFINSYRHFVGLSYLYPQAPHQGAVLEGFRFDFDLYYDPAWIATDDLDCAVEGMPKISREALFWLALQHFIKGYRCEGPVQMADFVGAWHKLLSVGAVCYNQTALTGEYKASHVNSYEEVYRYFFDEEEFLARYKTRLREFIEDMILEHDYFLPTAHFDEWLEQIEADHAEYQELLDR